MNGSRLLQRFTGQGNLSARPPRCPAPRCGDAYPARAVPAGRGRDPAIRTRPRVCRALNTWRRGSALIRVLVVCERIYEVRRPGCRSTVNTPAGPALAPRPGRPRTDPGCRCGSRSLRCTRIPGHRHQRVGRPAPRYRQPISWHAPGRGGVVPATAAPGRLPVSDASVVAGPRYAGRPQPDTHPRRWRRLQRVLAGRVPASAENAHTACTPVLNEQLLHLANVRTATF
jgi:hypothetical protein